MAKMKLTRLSEQDSDPVRILYWGDVGSGKTTDLAHLAHLGNVVYINREGGLKRRPLIQHGVPIDNIMVANPEDYSQIERLFWGVKRQVERNTDDPIVGVCLDSATDTQHMTMIEITEEKATTKNKDPFHATQDDWQKGNEKMRRIIRRFRDLPIHLGVAALSRRDPDEDDGTVRYGPAMTPGVATDVAGYMDIVCYCRVVEVGDQDEFQGVFRASKYLCKDRFYALPKLLVNPTFDRVIAYVEGRLTVETDDVMLEARERHQKAAADEKKKPTNKGAAKKKKPAK